MLSKSQKENIVKKFGLNDKDTGSVEVQLGLLTEKIKELAEHLKIHPKDKHSRLGLLKAVSQRKSFLSYLRRCPQKDSEKIVKELGL